MGGLVGSVTLNGELAGLIPYLKLGRLFHVGKGTSLGLGMFTIDPFREEGEPNREE